MVTLHDEVGTVRDSLCAVYSAWNAKCSQAIGVFTAYTAWTEGLRYAIVPHLYLIAAYEIAQRLFPKNIGALPVRSPSLRQKLT